jgi:hypothetical protein
MRPTGRAWNQLAERVRHEPIIDAMRSTLQDVAPLLTADATDEARRRLAHVYRHPDLQSSPRPPAISGPRRSASRATIWR